jgi:hypothetical protein
MVKKSVSTVNEEPEQRKFELPSEGVHTFQVVDANGDANNPNLVIVKLEVSEGDELGRSILHRVNLDESWKGFFLTRLFLKACGESYKGQFDADSDNWIGRQFKASIIHNKSEKTGKMYANIDQFEFDTQTEVNPDGVKNAADISWSE